MVRLVPSSVTGFARATFPVGEGDLRRGTKPSPGRGWLGEAETGVGRYEPGPGAAPSSGPAGEYRSSGVTVAVRLYPLIRHGLCPCHLPRRGRLPPAGDKTLSWERVARRSRDGCGAVRTRTRYRPSSGPCGATFPQGKVGGRRYEPGPGAAPLPAPGGQPSPRGRLEGFSSKNFKIYVDILGIQW